ncbi:sulfurtransferase complex subunit TusB [Zhongshania sp.]|uniref:sulfurtransferase complex subunit TusB n=1 Tax=Zhongshania sp. TaxID=1971902 RepID=UPI00356AD539
MSLHILSSPSSLNRCRFSMSDGDALILIEDAVVLAATRITLEHRNIRISALSDDVDRRGISPIAAITLVDYPGFVALCAQHRHCLSW